MKKQTGIWLDFREAFIIELQGNQEPRVRHIPSDIDTSHFGGGSRDKTPWGPMQTTSESKYLYRRIQEERRYFEDVMSSINDSDEIFIFGPAEAKDGLVKAIKKNKLFHPRLRAFETTDDMTLNRKIAHVREFFEEVANS